MVNKNTFSFLVISLFILALLTSCNGTKGLKSDPIQNSYSKIDIRKSSGGSSGMEQLNDSSYLVIYDIKIHKKGVRLGWVQLTDESINVQPIQVEFWDKDGLSNDLESICAIPGKKNEFLVAESGNWQGKLGRIFHIKVDFKHLTGKVLNTLKLPMLHVNDFDLVGDQYEAIYCLPYSKSERIILLGERGGSQYYPKGIIRWGLWNITNNAFTLEGKGLDGITVDAPGSWIIDNQKRSITDMHVDTDGIIWASASEDRGDMGPFYSVIYKLGKINPMNLNQPITVLSKIDIGREIYGFKIEALSGSSKATENGLSFGTEDEIYGGVWRPLSIITDR